MRKIGQYAQHDGKCLLRTGCRLDESGKVQLSVCLCLLHLKPEPRLILSALRSTVDRSKGIALVSNASAFRSERGLALYLLPSRLTDAVTG